MRPVTSARTCRVKVNDVEVTARPDDTLADACAAAGFPVSTLCHHGAVRRLGGCETCVVEVQGALVRACAEPVKEGLCIATSSPTARARRAAAVAALVADHPMECSVCPRDGACGLQAAVVREWPLPEGAREPAFAGVMAPHRDDWIVRPDLCVACGLCERFAEEVLGAPLVRVDPEAPPGPGRVRRVEDDAPAPRHYRAAFDEICPVGVFAQPRQARRPPAWRERLAASVCAGCATGCATWLHEALGDVHRVSARAPSAFLCDFAHAQSFPRRKGRVVVPFCENAPVSWDAALERAAHVLSSHVRERSLAVVVDAGCSVEDLVAVAKLACDRWRLDSVHVAERPPGEGDRVIRHPDPNANREGVQRVLRSVARPVEALRARLRAGEVTALLSIGAESDPLLSELLLSMPVHVPMVAAATFEGSLTRGAAVLLPLAPYWERPGSFVNHAGICQAFEPALPAAGDALPGWDLLNHLASRMQTPLGLDRWADVRREMRQRHGLEPGGAA